MTKADLAKKVSDECGVDRNTVMLTIDKVLDSIRESVVNGEEVFLRGFGTFGRKHRAEKIGQNMSQGTSVVIPAHDIPSFKPAKCFKNAIAKK